MDKKEWPAWKKWTVGIATVAGASVCAIVAAPICGAVLGIGATGPVAGGAGCLPPAVPLCSAQRRAARSVVREPLTIKP